MRFKLDRYHLTRSGPFSNDPAQALENSIAKWKYIVRKLEKCSTVFDDGGISTCNLCHLYYHPERNPPYCQGCPVSQRTGVPQCGNTPYEEMAEAEDAKDPILALAVAKREVAFLESLRGRNKK